MIIHLNSLGCELARYSTWAEFAAESRHIITEDGDQFVVRDNQAPWKDEPVRLDYKSAGATRKRPAA